MRTFEMFIRHIIIVNFSMKIMYIVHSALDEQKILYINNIILLNKLIANCI